MSTDIHFTGAGIASLVGLGFIGYGIAGPIGAGIALVIPAIVVAGFRLLDRLTDLP